ncbi:hypothetical protein ACFL2J_04285 [Candidatus Omnitrophota bacterium]
MSKFKDKGMALLTVVIIIFILMILSTVLISSLANQTRIVEHDISRIKAKYANEATMVRQHESLRRYNSTDTNHQVSGKFDSAQNWLVSVSADNCTIPGLTDLFEINTTIDYAPTF